MEAQTFINALLSIIIFLGSVIVHNIYRGMASMKASCDLLTNKVQSIEVLVAGHYVTFAALKDVIAPISAQLTRIETKLDGKEDKHG